MRLPAPVLAARGDPERLEADVVTAAPVARDPAQRREPHATAVRRHADAVDPGTADDGDTPPALGAGAEHGQRVVADPDVVRPAPRLEGRAQGVLLGREVHAGEEDLRRRERR